MMQKHVVDKRMIHLLREHIKVRGVPIGTIAEQMGMDDITLNDKLKGSVILTPYEYFRLCEVLSVNPVTIYQAAMGWR